MLKTLGFFALWLVGSATAVAVAWAGVSVVDDELINPASASDITTSAGAAFAEPGDPSSDRTTATSALSPSASTVSTTVDSEPSSSGSVRPPTTLGAQSPSSSPGSSTPAPAITSPPATVPTPAAAPGSTPSTSPTTSPATVPSPASTPPTAGLPTPPQTQTFNLVGGSTAISFSPSGVQVLWATPNPGFEVSIEPESPGLKVEFRADHHRSRVDAWWSNGPRHDIREEADD